MLFWLMDVKKLMSSWPIASRNIHRIRYSISKAVAAISLPSAAALAQTEPSNPRVHSIRPSFFGPVHFQI
jgi:hypothetical protein